jgi:hypothetical protein
MTFLTHLFDSIVHFFTNIIAFIAGAIHFTFELGTIAVVAAVILVLYLIVKWIRGAV